MQIAVSRQGVEGIAFSLGSLRQQFSKPAQEFGPKSWGLNLSREKFNGVVGRGAPHNTALKHKPCNCAKKHCEVFRTFDATEGNVKDLSFFNNDGQTITQIGFPAIEAIAGKVCNRESN
jgi:hypothetical protein